ncbi:hypothetical protein ACF06N_06245 [Streptomyces albidoflavus]
MKGTEPGAAARWLARLSVLAALGSVAVLVWAVDDGGLEVVAAALTGLVICAVGVWWFLAHRGVVRLLGAVLAVVAPAGVLALYAFGPRLHPAAQP